MESADLTSLPKSITHDLAFVKMVEDLNIRVYKVTVQLIKQSDQDHVIAVNFFTTDTFINYNDPDDIDSVL
jgi:hypothetical protein